MKAPVESTMSDDEVVEVVRAYRATDANFPVGRKQHQLAARVRRAFTERPQLAWQELTKPR